MESLWGLLRVQIRATTTEKDFFFGYLMANELSHTCFSESASLLFSLYSNSSVPASSLAPKLFSLQEP